MRRATPKGLGRRKHLTRGERLESRHLLAANLLAHWNANELNDSFLSNSIVDIWPDAIHQTAANSSGSPRLVKDAIFDRSVLRFETSDGADSFTVNANDSPFVSVGDFTVSVVFATDQTIAGDVEQWYEGINLVDTTIFNGIATTWGLSLNGNGQVLAGLGGPATTLASTASGLNDGLAHVAVFSRTGTTIALSIDGNAPVEITDVSDAERTTTSVAFGKTRRGGNAFDGDLADIRFYDGALSSNELTELYDQLADKYIAPVYDPAVAVPDEYLVDAGNVLVIESTVGVLTNEQNIDELSLSARLVRDVPVGMLTFESDGSFSYDPGDFTGVTSFTYRLNDSVADQNEVAVTLLVDTVPEPAADEYFLDEDTRLANDIASSVLTNDFDADGDSFVAALVDEPSHGTLSFSSDGTFEYLPDRDFFGTDTFTYTIDDGDQVSQPATVSLVVQPVNDAPVSVADGYVVEVNETLAIDFAQGVISNDLDVDSADLIATLIESPLRGSLELDADGGFVYTPANHFVGIDRFRYRISDGMLESSVATVEMFVGVAPVEISEFVVENYRSLTTRTRGDVDAFFGGDIESYDWIEVQNLSSSPYDVGGMILTDKPTRAGVDLSELWQFPIGTIIPAYGHMVVFASGLDIRDAELDENGSLHTNFRLSDDDEQIVLANSDGSFRHGFAAFGEQLPDVSFGTSADLSGLNPDLVGYQSTPTPGGPNASRLMGIVSDVVASVERGFHDEPFDVELSSSAGSQIYYTLDGSIPTNESEVYASPILVDGTSTLRAKAIQDGYVDSRVATYSYFFIDDILNQPADPAGFPADWGNASEADYEMSPQVATDVNSIYYDPLVAEGLRSLPSISVVMNVEDFFGEENGLQSFPASRGIEWERLTSVEFIDFEQFDDFQLDAGIRMVGNASRGANRRKHNMRLAFRDDYGASQVELPLFGIGENEAHDNLILRGGNGDSWVNPGVAQRAQYIRDQWQRDVQLAMGHESTHQLYSHLYVNGIYWGLYHVFERHDASFMALNFGGDEEDYDAIKDVNGTNGVDAVSGETDGWLEIFDFVDGEFSLEEKYAEVDRRVDLDNMIDYLLLNFYHGNNDWDHNNFRAGRHKDGKFVFFTWDAERADVNALQVGAGAIGPVDRNITTFSKVNRPTRIHATLSSHDEYRIRFADRVQRHFYNDGVLTPERAASFWNARADEIRLAMSAEAARWGDLHAPGDTTWGVSDWEVNLEIMNETFFPVRTGILLDQIAALLPDVAAPSLNQYGGQVANGFAVELAADTGTIWYTTDGSDPRLIGGGVSPAARIYRGPIHLYRDTMVNARVLLTDEWSALTSREFSIERELADLESLRISEVNYHPGALTAAEVLAGVTNADEFEFIELVNVGDAAIDLTNVELVRRASGGVEFRFADADIQELWPGERVLVVEDAAAFAQRYGDGLPVAGAWLGGLSNRSETITLSVGGVSRELTYSDQWYAATDGNGRTLERIDATNDDSASRASAWRVSAQVGGTPGLAGVRGDFSGDGQVGPEDVEPLHSQVRLGLNGYAFDLDGDGRVGKGDFGEWLAIAGYVGGDVNLDNNVDALDLAVWFDNRFRMNRGWGGADVNLDGVTDGSDFNAIQEQLVDAALAEPSAADGLQRAVLRRWSIVHRRR